MSTDDSLRDGVGTAGGTSRRTVLAAGCVGLAVICAGCARYGDDESPTPPPTGGAGRIPTAQVPVGGGIVLPDRGAVVTQPTAGRFVAFGTRCPHQGCAVNAVDDGTITCPCHGSTFHITDGSVAHGPAKTGLTPRPVTVDGDALTLT